MADFNCERLRKAGRELNDAIYAARQEGVVVKLWVDGDGAVVHLGRGPNMVVIADAIGIRVQALMEIYG